MIFLSTEELRELTGFSRKSAQIRALNCMGITHKLRADGVPLVAREHIAKVFDCYAKSRTRTQEPDWSALHATQAKQGK